jgi:hypothetical protein
MNFPIKNWSVGVIYCITPINERLICLVAEENKSRGTIVTIPAPINKISVVKLM